MRDYACKKCRRHYRLKHGHDYFCNCKQKEKQHRSHGPNFRAFIDWQKGVKAVKNPIGAESEKLWTRLDLLPELKNVFGIERSKS